MRRYLPPLSDDGAAPAPAAAAAVVELGSVVVPLAKVTAVANKPVQAIWALRDASGAATGDVTLETSWLPACCTDA